MHNITTMCIYFSGLVRLQQLYQDINFREIDLDIIVKRIVSVQSCHQMLRDIYNEITKEPLRVFLDLTSDQSQEVITAIVGIKDILYRLFKFHLKCFSTIMLFSNIFVLIRLMVLINYIA